MTMQILFYSPDTHLHHNWLSAFQAALPDATIRVWQEGDDAPADYAAVWKPLPGILGQRTGLKGVFNLGAGVDALLAVPDLPTHIPVVRIDDGGMALQMAEYVTFGVLQHVRRMDVYRQQQANAQWNKLAPLKRAQCRVGIFGMGVLGTRIAESLLHLGFPVHGWSRTQKNYSGIQSFYGDAQRDAFLAQTDILVCALPLTAQTTDILNRATMQLLADGAYIINIARGQHIVDTDLISLIDSGKLSGAMLDVFRTEPLPQDHPFWHHPHIDITPHISALTMIDETATQIARKIQALEQGLPVNGIVNTSQGY
jgi:glyoxylate/hydroxypyruvate reductase A